MSTATVRLLATNTTEAIDATTPALSAPHFSRMYRDAHGQSAEVPAEVHTDPMWAGPDAAEAHETLCRDLTEAATVAGNLDGGYVLLAGQGSGGCDVWARFEMAE